MDYKPYDCEICKCKSEWYNVLSCYSDVTCKKYNVELTSYPRELALVNDKIYKNLKSHCECKKCYPSKWKLFWFKVYSLMQKYYDKKYHRNED